MAVDLIKRVRGLLLAQDVGTLSTHSADCPGYPFGSLVPVAFDDVNRPVLLLSRLAQHTRNIAEKPKLSLMLSDISELGNNDVQTCARVTLLAEAEKLDIETEAQTIARYCRFYPQAESYYQELDFDFYRLKPEKVRFIAGFGQIHWLNPEQLFTLNPLAGEADADICSHMNSDHADALLRYCQLADVAVPEGVEPMMVGVDAFGFHQRVGERVFRFDFLFSELEFESVQTPDEARQALIAMLKPSAD